MNFERLSKDLLTLSRSTENNFTKNFAFHKAIEEYKKNVKLFESLMTSDLSQTDLSSIKADLTAAENNIKTVTMWQKGKFKSD